MNRIAYGIIFSLVCNALYAAPADSAMVQDLNARYKSIKHNLHLINKCYFTKSATCNADERAQAWTALKQTGGLVGGLIVVLGVGGGIWRQYRAMRQELHSGKHGKTEQFSELPLPTGSYSVSSSRSLEEDIKKRIPEIQQYVANTTHLAFADKIEVRKSQKQAGIYAIYIPTEIDDIPKNAQKIANEIHKKYSFIKVIFMGPEYKGSSKFEVQE